eukprot:TRINITY_DN2_c0_g1_i1.p1 TRINITY_DN2_c0_g1~~TRINITY_DN2_c0_g1_i1.p1  ORF type:complete len:270 (-),score=47.44 TRINITY_DN2_c0_g1_i1:479-1288(-)
MDNCNNNIILFDPDLSNWSSVDCSIGYYIDVDEQMLPNLNQILKQIKRLFPLSEKLKHIKRIWKKNGSMRLFIGLCEDIDNLIDWPITYFEFSIMQRTEIPLKTPYTKHNHKLANDIWSSHLLQYPMGCSLVHPDFTNFDAIETRLFSLIESYQQPFVIFFDKENSIFESLTLFEELIDCTHPLKSLYLTAIDRLVHSTNPLKPGYLLTELDCYAYLEPNVYEAMCLIHSRCRRLFFHKKIKANGGIQYEVQLKVPNHKMFVAQILDKA